MPAAVSRYFEVAENSPSASTRPSFAAWIAVFNPTPSGKLLNARGPRAMIRVRSLLYAMRVRCFLVFWLPQPDRTMPVRGAVHGQPTSMRRHRLSAKPRLFAICSEQILINENPAAMSGRKGAAGSSLSRWAKGEARACSNSGDCVDWFPQRKKVRKLRPPNTMYAGDAYVNSPEFRRYPRVRFTATPRTRRARHSVSDVLAFRVVEHFEARGYSVRASRD